MKVKEVMNKAIAVEHDMTIKEAAKIMSDKNIGSLVAVNKGKIVGILTESDITRNIPDINKKVSQAMSKKVITIEENEDMDEAALLMKKNKIKRLPVIDSEERLIGIITATDIIAHSEDISDEFMLD